jgi:hypothetical protein
MRRFKDYINGATTVKPKKVVAEQIDQKIVSYNSDEDRWSRNAKHPIRLQDVGPDSFLEEGVIGGMQPLGPINRIMQLAGISVPTTVGEELDQPEDVQTLSEADPTNMFQQLYTANTNDAKYKNNPQAAKLATIGQVLTGLNTQIGDLQGQIPSDLQSKLNMVVGLGALLIQQADQITKPQTTTEDAQS